MCIVLQLKKTELTKGKCRVKDLALASEGICLINIQEHPYLRAPLKQVESENYFFSVHFPWVHFVKGGAICTVCWLDFDLILREWRRQSQPVQRSLPRPADVTTAILRGAPHKEQKNRTLYEVRLTLFRAHPTNVL